MVFFRSQRQRYIPSAKQSSLLKSIVTTFIVNEKVSGEGGSIWIGRRLVHCINSILVLATSRAFSCLRSVYTAAVVTNITEEFLFVILTWITSTVVSSSQVTTSAEKVRWAVTSSFILSLIFSTSESMVLLVSVWLTAATVSTLFCNIIFQPEKAAITGIYVDGLEAGPQGYSKNT